MTTAGAPASSGARRIGRALRPTVKALPEHARAHNRSMVLATLFHDGNSSRADIARSTGLTRVTVSDLVSDLIAEGLVTELGVKVEGRVGKPATLVGLDATAFQIVALDLTDDSELVGAVLTMHGELVSRRTAPLEGRRGDDVVELLVRLAADLVEMATSPVLGVGIASPGVIDQDGHVVQAPNLGWYDLPLAALLTERLGVPVHVANDANTRALGEFTYGEAAGSGSMVVTIGQGVGAGIVVDGALVVGKHHAAGEIGHVTVVDEGSAQEPAACACGRRGCLETVLSVPALRARVAGLDPQDSDAALASVGRLLGIALAPVVSALDLGEVLLSGPRELLDGPLLEAALDAVRARTMPVIGQGLTLRMGSLDEDGVLTGAAVLVLSGQLGVT